jgi:hypothetical protein
MDDFFDNISLSFSSDDLDSIISMDSPTHLVINEEIKEIKKVIGDAIPSVAVVIPPTFSNVPPESFHDKNIFCLNIAEPTLDEYCSALITKMLDTEKFIDIPICHKYLDFKLTAEFDSIKYCFTFMNVQFFNQEKNKMEFFERALCIKCTYKSATILQARGLCSLTYCGNHTENSQTASFTTPCYQRNVFSFTEKRVFIMKATTEYPKERKLTYTKEMSLFNNLSMKIVETKRMFRKVEDNTTNVSFLSCRVDCADFRSIIFLLIFKNEKQKLIIYHSSFLHL